MSSCASTSSRASAGVPRVVCQATPSGQTQTQSLEELNQDNFYKCVASCLSHRQVQESPRKLPSGNEL
eukprot:scaffold52225_cov21-Tisochrysis_lutea.AAC.2